MIFRQLFDTETSTYTYLIESLKSGEALLVESKEEYVELMEGLELSDPKLMDVAVPANQLCGRVP